VCDLRFVYEEAKGCPDQALRPNPVEGRAENWTCPRLRRAQADFEMVEI